MRLTFFTILLTLLLVASSSAVQASCLVPEVNEGFKQAKAVFIGEVEEIIAPPGSDRQVDFFFALVKFKIEKSWKGPVFESVAVHVPQGKAFSALRPMRKGERYLVYADAFVRNEVETNELLVSACNRTALLPMKPTQPTRILDPHIDRENGSGDLRALDGLMIFTGSVDRRRR